MLQDRLAALEGAEACLATGTGMAGVFAALACQLDRGDRVVASRALFGACYAILNDILPRWGDHDRICRRHRSRSVARRADDAGEGSVL